MSLRPSCERVERCWYVFWRSFTQVGSSVCRANGVKTLEDGVPSHRSATSKRVRLWLKARSRCPCQAEVSSLSCRSGTVSLCLNTRTCKDPYEVLLRKQKHKGTGAMTEEKDAPCCGVVHQPMANYYWQCGGRLAWRRHWLCFLYVGQWLPPWYSKSNDWPRCFTYVS